VSGTSSYGLFVTIGGTVEGLVHISEITYGHVNNIDQLGKIGDKVQVKVIGLENGKISLSSKKLKDDPWTELPKAHKVGDIIEGEVIRFVPYGVFVRVFNDINGLVHLSELSQRSIQNPNEVVKLGQIVKAKIILLDPKNRKIGLSMKGLLEGDDKVPAPKAEVKKAVATGEAAPKKAEEATEAPAEAKVEKPKAKSKGLGDVLKKLTEDKDTADKAEKMMEKAPKEVKKIARKPVAEKEPKAAKADAPKKTTKTKKVD